MKLRIAIWAIVGALVLGLWNLAFVARVSPIALDFAYLTCPIVALVSHHAISFSIALAINAATYAMIGFLVEITRLHYNRTRLISN